MKPVPFPFVRFRCSKCCFTWFV